MSEQELLECRLEEALGSNAALAAAAIPITTVAVHLPVLTADQVAHWFSLTEG